MVPRDGAGASRGLVQVEQPWTDAGMARLYDAFQYDADLPWYLELAAAQGGRVLELACGSGRVLLPLARAGHEVVGLDSSPHMLALAREQLDAEEPAVAGRVRLQQGDMREFQLGQTFELAIIAARSFAYLLTRADQQHALAAVAAHLRPGGLLALDLLNPPPAWLLAPPGSLHQDVVQYDAARRVTIARTEAVVSTDLATQIRVIRSAYEVVADDASRRSTCWSAPASRSPASTAAISVSRLSPSRSGWCCLGADRRRGAGCLQAPGRAAAPDRRPAGNRPPGSASGAGSAARERAGSAE